LATTQEILDEVDAAILAWGARGGIVQLVIGGISKTFTDIDKLKTYRRELRAELLNGTTGGGRNYAAF
jgi:hypothetical protein